MSADYEQPFDQNRVRWNGSGSAVVGRTPFGIYDSDPEFITEAPKAADWAAKRLGYPIVDIEMIDVNFYACFEEAVNEYGRQINEFNIRENMLLLAGTDAEQDATQRNINGTPLNYYIKMAQVYGTEAGAGGDVDWKRGHINVKSRQQTYDLDELWANCEEGGADIEVRRIFHHRPAAIARIYDPFSMTGMSYSNIFNEMGFGGYSPATQFLMTPIFEDLLRTQAIEFNDTVRKSQYSFELVNNKLRIFPIPTDDFKLWFEYLLTAERADQIYDRVKDKNGNIIREVGDPSNAPYKFLTYKHINQPGKQWIWKYFLALCKELLGSIRQKYQSIPIPGAEVTLDGGELRSEAQQEKEQLITQLRESLEKSGRQAQLEAQAKDVESLQAGLKGVPLKIYVY
jgi:hypothetical protein